MTLNDYQACLGAVPYGKRLPTAIYLHREGLAGPAPALDRLVSHLADRYQIGPEFNVLKFRSNELKVSFLSYPRFFEDPHPALRQAVTVDLVQGKARHTDYPDNPNPPILHRKEAFLPADHPKRRLFTALTEAEEAAGLYADTTTIGFKLNWEQLVASKGLRYRGHRLLPAGGGDGPAADSHPEPAAPSPALRAPSPVGWERDGVRDDVIAGPSDLPTAVDRRAADLGTRTASAPRIERHKTALVRYELSKPVRTLLEYGQLGPGVTFFDYGCGQGADVTGLRNLGYAADGWDPVHRPDSRKTEADVLNLGYVLNVIEDPAERLATLVDAFRHTRRLLVVSALIRETVDTETAATFGDGVLTKRNTFQKYFDQPELQQYVEDALETTVVPVSLGIFYVFRDPVAQQDFIEARTRRTIDWTQISARLGLGQPRRSRWELFYEQHQELLDAFWTTVLRLGRLPAPEEFERHAELRELMGSPKRALRLFVKRGGAELLSQSTETRKNDLLVYMALSNLRKRVPFGHLSASLRLDIRTFFGNHKAAVAKGLELLYAAGDPGEIELACEDLKLGWQDEQALHFHRSLLDQLPPVLRAYVGCATTLFGDVQQADVVKLHKASGKVTFLAYDDFEGKPLPELRFRTKVNLRTRWVQVFDHSAEGQLLYFKERLLGADHPRLPEMQAFSAKLRKAGMPATGGGGCPSKAELLRFLDERGLNERLNRRRSRPAFSNPTLRSHSQ